MIFTARYRSFIAVAQESKAEEDLGPRLQPLYRVAKRIVHFSNNGAEIQLDSVAEELSPTTALAVTCYCAARLLTNCLSQRQVETRLRPREMR